MKANKEHGNNNLLMQLNKRLGKKWPISIICVVASTIVFFACNYVINCFIHLFKKEYSTENLLNTNNFFKIQFSIITSNKFILLLYVFTLILIIVIVLKIIYGIHTSFADMNIGQKGSSRATTTKEIKEQYKEVPDKDISFPGHGGLPVARMGDKLYIDEDNTNVVILGITRAGKGEIIAVPMIDLYSRAEIKDSMVILDMKLEHISRSYNTLVARGYEVLLLNIEDPTIGIQYNPLDLIVKYYRNGFISDAELLCNSFGYSIFSSSGTVSGDAGTFFLDNATNAVAALILAHITDCMDEDNRANANAQILFTRKQLNYENLIGENKEVALKEYFENKITEFTLKNIQKVKVIPDTVKFIPTYENLKKVTMNSIVNTFTGLARVHINQNLTQLDVYFQKRPNMDRAKAIYSSIEVAGGDKTKGSIFSQALTKLNIYCYENISKMTSQSTFDIESIGFGEKPVALFIGVPFYDRSKDSIVSTLIGQVYQSNARKASQTRDLKCDRRIIYHLDEIGNYPAIKDFKTMLSVGLGINMVFNLFIQTYNQLDSTYGNDSATIKDNCGTHVYIQTSSYDTAELFSKLIGTETITNITRSGQKLSLSKTITELYEERPILNPNELMEFRPGELAIKRVMKRTALDGTKVVPYPIINTIERGTSYLYSYEYLSSTFPSTTKISDLNIPKNENLDGNNVYDFNITMNKYAYVWLKQVMNSGDEDLIDKLTPKDLQDYEYFKTYYKFDEKLKFASKGTALLRSAQANNLNISGENTLAEFIDQMCKSDISLKDKDLIFDLIERTSDK